MNEKVCENCKWYKESKLISDGYCCRYPQWIHVACCTIHYCGEWGSKE